MTHAYPDTTLNDDVLDDDFGAQPASKFGQPAFKWLNSMVRFLGQAYLTYVRQPHPTVVVLSQSSANAGDVAAWGTGNFVPNGGYYIGKYSGSLTDPILFGIYLEPCSVGAKARVAHAGVVSSTITGIPPQSSPQDAGLDATNGRVRVAEPGDLVIGTIDLQGNVLFTAHGMPGP